jgi:hypothetical protein
VVAARVFEDTDGIGKLLIYPRFYVVTRYLSFYLLHPIKVFMRLAARPSHPFFNQSYRSKIRHTIHHHRSNMASSVNKTAHPFEKARLEALLNRRFFYAPAFEIYGGECEHSTKSGR